MLFLKLLSYIVTSKSAVNLAQVWWSHTVHKKNNTNKSQCCDFWKRSNPGCDEKSCIHFTVKCIWPTLFLSSVGSHHLTSKQLYPKFKWHMGIGAMLVRNCFLTSCIVFSQKLFERNVLRSLWDVRGITACRSGKHLPSKIHIKYLSAAISATDFWHSNSPWCLVVNMFSWHF